MPPAPLALAAQATHVLRPHFVFRPQQLLTRLQWQFAGAAPQRTFRLPWGALITARTANPDDPLGRHLTRRGILDPLLCETLLRLTQPGEATVDVGANIGQMTSLMAHAVGPKGRVLALEPHPETFQLLVRNCRRWSASAGMPEIDARELGVSSRDGSATLTTDVYEVNQGSPSLEPWTDRRGELDQHTVSVAQLDVLLADWDRIDVLKMDIEGHELHALRGAEGLLERGAIRDIVFEERDATPTPVTQLLEDRGYTIMRIGERLRGPILGPLAALEISSRDDPSFLATRDPERAVRVMGERGWAVFGVGPAARTDHARRRSAGTAA